ncbi:hypothetical protein FACS1894179_01480 [Bacteroidia bacterium]|nr:hypothetical protein FACS1894169_03280 [Bacteroidia bacterium]GHV38302.1 hypothetical protein FACS1894179_01480 [Bacteroidia bacterium]
MKLKEIRESYEFHTGKLSDIVRQLAFAGIGIIWIFRTSNSDNSNYIPNELLYPLISLITSLVFDIFHYLYSSVFWYIIYFKSRKKDNNEESDVEEKECWSIPSWLFFALKTLFLIIAYILLFIYLLKILNKHF